ncbi:MAG: imelysin family protein [Steroidobacteraceae bacterium]
MNMKRLLRIFGGSTLIAAGLLAGCAKAPADDPRRPVLNTYADIVLATYEDTLKAAKALDASVDALLAAPSEQTLADARDKWRAARIPYDHSEAFRFYGGPIDGEGGPEGQLNGWPLDENHIDSVGAAYNAAPGLNIVGNAAAFPSITPKLVSEQNEAGGEKNIASGYHAIEFLLWGQDLNQTPDASGQRPYTDYVVKGDPATDVAARRGQYLKAATTLLISDLQSLVTAWTVVDDPAVPSYRRDFVTGDVYTGLKRMLTGMVGLSEVEMAGERLAVPLLSGDQEEEQSCFSDFTSNDLQANVAGIKAVYLGRYERLDGSVVSGPSLAEFVAKADAMVAEEMKARLESTSNQVAAIHSPFDREIRQDNTEGHARVQAGADALRSLAISLGRAATALGIFMSPIQGSGD